MRRVLAATATLLLLTTAPSHAQVASTGPSTIKISKSIFGPSYRYQGKKLKTKNLPEVFKSIDDPEPARLLEQSKRFSTISDVLGYPGAVLAGFATGHRTSDGKHSVALMAVGYGLLATGIGFGIAAAHKEAQSVERFNDAVNARIPRSFHILPPDGFDHLFRVAVSF